MSSSDIDIIVIDTNIRNNFKKQHTDIYIYKKRLSDIEDSLKNLELNNKNKHILENSYKYLLKYIEDLENETQYNFYIIRTVEILEEYKELLNEPIKLSFLGKNNKNNKNKVNIINKYMEIANEYIIIDNLPKNKEKIICKNCNNKKDFEIIDNSIYICNVCYNQQLIQYNSSYSDVLRINISSKYMYDRKVHFRDCIKQYQGKQNCNISTKIYTDLFTQFNNHHLILKNEINDKDKFKNITKNHILVFLKELSYSNQYENVHLIHYNLTGIKPDDISHLEGILLDDFDVLTELYDNKFKDINRKNFINTQYVLYQLLLRHKHSCKKEDFIILKTIDRKYFHDEICKSLFEHLGWNFSPFY